ncbi:MAG TPA: SDR family NAD(P)-dependent oxidoreductase [Candidatus Binataceae bacterium]|nr:SDR family NAD(P)-dependent oxidoreductase [Candidatus Binataceae bacterium]
MAREPDPGKHKHRVSLVSGGNRGIGFEVVRQLAALGHTVILGSRDLAKGEAAARAIGDGVPERVIAARLDVTDLAGVEDAVKEIDRRFGALDVLINNAAIHYDTWQTAVAADVEGVVRDAFETNLLGAWRMIRACVPLMRRNRYGRIVNVSSGAGAISSMGAGTPAYSTSKAALNALTIIVADELRDSGILVNAVCPGWVATEMGGAGGRPVAEGAAGIVWAATLPDRGPTGGFFRDRKPISW